MKQPNPNLTRISALVVAASLALIFAGWSSVMTAQDERDFVFTDDEGHLVLRFAGAIELDADQREEIVNVQLSTMVHDRLRADIAFEAEPVDSIWADSMKPRIEQYVRDRAPEFSAPAAECRSGSCRLVLQHSGGWSVSEHQSLMGSAQRAIQAFIDAKPESFEPVFLIAAHYQEPEPPYIKVFMQRAAVLRFPFSD